MMRKFYYNEEATINTFMVDDCDNSKNSGKRVKIKDPTCLAEKSVFHIVGVQRIYDGSLAYRVQVDENDIGRPVSFDRVIFVD